MSAGPSTTLVDPGCDLRRGIGQLRTQGEQIALQVVQPGVQRRDHTGGPGLPQHGVELVDVTIRVHARIGLAHPRTVKERRLSSVAGSRVDLHASDYTE